MATWDERLGLLDPLLSYLSPAIQQAHAISGCCDVTGRQGLSGGRVLSHQSGWQKASTT